MRRLKIGKIREILGMQHSDMARVFVTPATARELLDGCNRRNRKLRQDNVERLRKDMESGRWYDDVDMIGISENGLLVNGQHRLEALAGADVEGVWMKFCLGVEQHPSMDTGATRSYADLVRLNRRAHPEDLMPNKWRTVVLAGRALGDQQVTVTLAGSEKPVPLRQLSNSELGDFWLKHKELLAEIEGKHMFDLCKGAGASVKSSILWAALDGVPMDTLEHFTRVLRDGIANSDTDIPIIRLRDELMTMRVNGAKGTLMKAAYTQQCIFDVLRGSTSNRLNGRPTLYYQKDLSGT